LGRLSFKKKKKPKRGGTLLCQTPEIQPPPRGGKTHEPNNPQHK